MWGKSAEGEGEGLSARQGFDRRFVVKKGWFAWSPLWMAGPVGTGVSFFFFSLFFLSVEGALCDLGKCRGCGTERGEGRSVL